MSLNENVSEAAQQLKELANRVRGENASLGGQIELLANDMESLANGRPVPKTSDFDIAGELQEIPGSETGDVLERIIDENDLLPVYFLQQGAVVQRSVARVVLLEPVSGLPAGSGWGTGSMISRSLFLTNNHVIPDINFAAKVRMQFNYQLGAGGLDEPTQSYYPDLIGTFHTNIGLDYTVIRLKKGLPSPQASVAPLHAGDSWGWISLNDAPGYHLKQHFNIIQHPQGRRKEIALQDNEISSLYTNVVRYNGDTEPGSSGSPILDNLWRMIALHHAGGDYDHQAGKWLNNEGIRVDKIVQDLRDHFGNNSDILEELGI